MSAAKELLREAADVMERRAIEFPDAVLDPALALRVAAARLREEAYLLAFPEHLPRDRAEQIAAMRKAADA